MGAPVRAYGPMNRRRVKRDDERTGRRSRHWRSAALFPRDVLLRHRCFVIVALGAFYGPEWDSRSAVSAFIFPVRRLPVRSQTAWIYDTQTAIAGWRKILTVPDLPTSCRARPRRRAAGGPIQVRTTELGYSYREGTGGARHLGRGRTRHARRHRRRPAEEDHVREALVWLADPRKPSR